MRAELLMRAGEAVDARGRDCRCTRARLPVSGGRVREDMRMRVIKYAQDSRSEELRMVLVGDGTTVKAQHLHTVAILVHDAV